MQRNQYKTTEDFLDDISFRKWILEGDDQNNWTAWMAAYPDNQEVATEARLWLLAMGGKPEHEMPAAEIQDSLNDTWEKIHSHKKNTSYVKLPWSVIWKVAAVLVIGIGIVFLKDKFNTGVKNPIAFSRLPENSKGYFQHVNTTDKPQLVTLSDGSSIVLLPNSKLNYPEKFDAAERRVYLSGEAFFEISKNPLKPFFVFANEVTTRVVGTSFRIKAYPDQTDIEVSVRTGKVNVYSNEKTGKENPGIELNPNETVRFLRENLSFGKITDSVTGSSHLNALGLVEQFNFEFTDTPVTRIFETIERAYPVAINYPAEVLKDCYLSSSLTDEPLPEKLKIICESLGKNTRYEMKDQQITIISNGCN